MYMSMDIYVYIIYVCTCIYVYVYIDIYTDIYTHIFIYNMYVCIIQGVLTGTLARGQDYAGAPDGNSPAATLHVPHLYDVNVNLNPKP